MNRPGKHVIPSEIQGSRSAAQRLFSGIFRLRFAPLKMTRPRRDPHSPVARHDRSARSHQSEQRLCNPDRAVITLAPLVFEGDDFLVLTLFDNFSSHLCSGDERVAVSHIFSISKQQYITERGSFARFDIEKIDIEGVAFRDAKLPATSSDDCVSHSFSGRKKPPTIPHPSALGKRKPDRRSGLTLRSSFIRRADKLRISSFITLRSRVL